MLPSLPNEALVDNKEKLAPVMAQLFPGVESEDLVARWQALLNFVSATRYSYEHGPLRQALVLKYSSPLHIEEGTGLAKNWISFRIELRDGIVYALCISGVVARVECVLDMVAIWLAARAYREDAFEGYQNELTKLLSAQGEFGDHQDVRVEVGANLPIHPRMNSRMICSIALAALNELRARYSLDSLAVLPQTLHDHFAYQISLDNVAATAFLAGLDPEARSLMQRRRQGKGMQLGELAFYNYLAHGDAMVRRNRRQAVTAFPLLLPVLVRPLPPADPYRREAQPYSGKSAALIAGAVDQGLPLFKAVAQTYSVTVEAVRWLVNRDLPPDWIIDCRRMGLLLRLVSWVAREKRPRDSQEWERMLQVGRALSEPLRLASSNGDNRGLFGTRYPEVLKGWFSDLTQGKYLADLPALPDSQLERDLADSKDFLEMLYLGLHAHCHAAATPGDEADDYLRFVLDWLCGRSLGQSLAVSHRRHAAILRMSEDPEPEPARPQAWPPVLLQPARIGQLMVSELVDSQSLILEGKLMQHCVGTYVEHCLQSDELLFSIRDASGMPLSTAQLRIASDRLAVSIVQHRGRGNGPASPDCADAANGLLELLNRPEQATLLRRRQLFQRRNRVRQKHVQQLKLKQQSASVRAAQRAALALLVPGAAIMADISMAQLYTLTGVPRHAPSIPIN